MTEPRQVSEGQPSGGREGDPNDIVVVYVCEKCRSYVGSSTIGHLEEQVNTKVHSQEITHARNRCPYCGADRHRRYARLISKVTTDEIEQEVTRRVRKKFEERAKSKQEATK